MSIVISVLNQKGGSGKTTTSIHLARAFQLLGKTVSLIDGDPQGSSRDWAAATENSLIPVAGVDRANILQKYIGSINTDIIIYDGAPAVEELSTAAIKVSDIIIIPVQPSALDIWASNALVDKIKQRIEITDGKLKATFLVSRNLMNTKIGKEITDILKDFDLPVLDTIIHQRIAYSKHISSGTTVLDKEPNSDAAKDVMKLVKEIIEKYIENAE